MLETPKLIHVGNNNWVAANLIVAVSTLKSITVRRSFEEAKAAGLLLDFTGQQKTRSILLMQNGIVIRTMLRPGDVARLVASLDLDAENQVG